MNTKINSYVSRYVVPFYFDCKYGQYGKIIEKLNDKWKWVIKDLLYGFLNDQKENDNEIKDLTEEISNLGKKLKNLKTEEEIKRKEEKNIKVEERKKKIAEKEQKILEELINVPLENNNKLRELQNKLKDDEKQNEKNAVIGQNDLTLEDLQKEIKIINELGLPKDTKWEEKGFLGKSKDKSPEMDTFSYLIRLLDCSNSENNLGTSFVLESKELLTLEYKCSAKENEDKPNFSCNKLGILLFKNGIGFLWYEIEFDKKEITTDEYIKFQNDFKELARNKSNISRKDKTGDFKMGEWIYRLLVDFFSLKINFWAERKQKIDDKDVCIPDKALLFQYLFTEHVNKQERMSLAFYIANGYDKKYIPPALESEIYEPFGNVCYHISVAGMSCVASNDDNSNSEFFKNSFKSKFISDYFLIYVLLLYQTYSCFNYSRLLSEELSADINSIDLNKIAELDAQIDLFLVKSTYGAVSNIHHQNGVYNYGKKALRIKENIESITAGLAALRGIEEDRQEKIEQERNKKRDIGLSIFGSIVVISAAYDALCLINWFCIDIFDIDINENLIMWYIIAGIVILCLTAFLIFTLVRNKHNNK